MPLIAPFDEALRVDKDRLLKLEKILSLSIRFLVYAMMEDDDGMKIPWLVFKIKNSSL